MSDLGDWFRSIPLITRYWFAASIAVPLVGKLGLINAVNLILWPENFLHKFQIWRPITATFYFPVGPKTGFLYMVNLYFLYQYSTRLETGAFDGRPADYVFMLLFNWICIVIGERIRVILDMEDKTLAFERGYEYLGVAFRGLPKACLYPAVSAVYGNTEVTLVYLGKPLDG